MDWLLIPTGRTTHNNTNRENAANDVYDFLQWSLILDEHCWKWDCVSHKLESFGVHNWEVLCDRFVLRRSWVRSSIVCSSVLFNVQHNEDRDCTVPNPFITRNASVLPNRWKLSRVVNLLSFRACALDTLDCFAILNVSRFVNLFNRKTHTKQSVHLR